MKLSFSGLLFLAGYVVMVGSASFLQKYAMKEISPYQVNFLMAVGMIVTTIPALLIAQGSLSVPLKALSIGAPVGLMMALGSISFVLALTQMEVGTATAMSTSYAIVAALLSWLFLNEQFTWTKIAGIAMTLVGIALISMDRNN